MLRTEEVQDNALALGRLTSFRAIFAVAVPAALFRVSDVLSSTLQTSLVSKHGGTEMLAAFAAVGVTTRTTLKLFAFMLDGVAAKVGRSAAHEPAQALRARLRLYFASCLVLGLTATAVLLAGQDHILLPFNLTSRVRELADPYWVLLSLLLPLMLTNMAISGTLQGLRHVGVSAALEALGAAAEIAGTYMVLTASWLPRHSSRLAALGLVKLGVTVVTSGAGLSLIAWLLPRSQQQQQQQQQQRHDHTSLGEDTLATPLLGGKLPTYSSTAIPESLDPPSPTSVLPLRLQQQQEEQGQHEEQGSDSDATGAKAASRQVDRAEVALAYLAELVRDGLNVMTRSIVVQGSMWLTAVAAARLGTAPLAAHQILTQLWMLPSHFFGGFAVAAIVLGSRLALQGGEGGANAVAVRRAQRRLSSRLVLLAASLGAAVGCALALWKAQAIGFFHPKDGVAPALAGPAWHAMCALQPLTAAIFTLTGLIFGAQLFAFMRNVLLAGFLGLFCPLIFWVIRKGPDGAAGLGAVWSVKVGFYVWQVIAEAVGVGRAYGYFAR